MQIEWIAFLEVFAVALGCAAIVVTFYALGLRLLVSGGRAPVVPPAEFPDAIAVRSGKQAAKAEKKAAKAAAKTPLTQGQQSVRLGAAYVCFGICAVAVLGAVLYLVLY